MTLWLYAIVPTDCPVDPGNLESAVVADFQVLYRPLDDQWAMTAEALRRHATVVGRLHRTHSSLLPFRFGQTVPDRETLAERLAARSRPLRKALDEVAGCSQWSLRLLESGSRKPDPGTEESPRRTSGTEYLRARRRQSTWPPEPADLAELRERLHGLSRREQVQARGGVGWRAAAYYLVHSEQEHRFCEAIDAACLSGRGRRWSLTGPGPPWAFGP